MNYTTYTLLLVLLLSQCRPKQDNTITQFAGKPEVPSTIKKEHEFLLEKIEKLTLFKDSTGIVATTLNELMQHHFTEEENYVLPPLGLLPSLVSGKLPEHSKEVIMLTEKFKLQQLHMSAEHQMIIALTEEMLQVGNNEARPEIIELQKELHKHASTEEEVFFPTALLIGEYLKLKSLPVR